MNLKMSANEQDELQYEGVVESKDDTGNEDPASGENDQFVEDEIEAIKAKVREMEEEAEKLRQIQSEVDKQMSIGSPPGGAAGSQNLTIEAKMEADNRSIYVGSVDYGTTAEELEQHFHGCGAVNRVTILCNKYDGHPKGFAYIEFTEPDSAGLAMALDDSLFRGRKLKVMPKRTNKPGISTSHRPPKELIRRRSRRRPSYMAYRPYRGRRFHYSPY